MKVIGEHDVNIFIVLASEHRVVAVNFPREKRHPLILHRRSVEGDEPAFGQACERTDDGIGTVVPALLSLGLSGVPYVTHDIAGYSSYQCATSTKELFQRWTELLHDQALLAEGVLPRDPAAFARQLAVLMSEG